MGAFDERREETHSYSSGLLKFGVAFMHIWVKGYGFDLWRIYLPRTRAVIGRGWGFF